MRVGTPRGKRRRISPRAAPQAFVHMQRIFGEGNFSYFPPTFVLPDDALALRAAEARGDGPYMHKVDRGSQGVGVELVDPVPEKHLR